MGEQERLYRADLAQSARPDMYRCQGRTACPSPAHDYSRLVDFPRVPVSSPERRLRALQKRISAALAPGAASPASVPIQPAPARLVQQLHQHRAFGEQQARHLCRVVLGGGQRLRWHATTGDSRPRSARGGAASLVVAGQQHQLALRQAQPVGQPLQQRRRRPAASRRNPRRPRACGARAVPWPGPAPRARAATKPTASIRWRAAPSGCHGSSRSRPPATSRHRAQSSSVARASALSRATSPAARRRRSASWRSSRASRPPARKDSPLMNTCASSYIMRVRRSSRSAAGERRAPAGARTRPAASARSAPRPAHRPAPAGRAARACSASAAKACSAGGMAPGRGGGAWPGRGTARSRVGGSVRRASRCSSSRASSSAPRRAKADRTRHASRRPPRRRAPSRGGR